jgi:hypothetical protein
MIRRLAEGHDPRFPGAKMLDNTLDCTVFAARIPTFEDDQNLVAVLYGVFLNFYEFDLDVMKRCGVSFTTTQIAIFIRIFCHGRFPLEHVRQRGNADTGSEALRTAFR